MGFSEWFIKYYKIIMNVDNNCKSNCDKQHDSWDFGAVLKKRIILKVIFFYNFFMYSFIIIFYFNKFYYCNSNIFYFPRLLRNVEYVLQYTYARISNRSFGSVAHHQQSIVSFLKFKSKLFRFCPWLSPNRSFGS